ncbi:hypothetical protein Sango_1591000 [Sesamum angolense]|uniref:RNase H type-1 domain-containing protein n=1 Tax=Sesamum angolense TaxID=2727404 RepID=A0AAE1WQP5_9LAMI|nr:hypothetical protein Sango_1591000 [Sesamum angolense]
MLFADVTLISAKHSEVAQVVTPGLGLCDLMDFNKAMLAKQILRIITKPDNLMVRVMEARYSPHSFVPGAHVRSNPSLLSIVYNRLRICSKQDTGLFIVHSVYHLARDLHTQTSPSGGPYNWNFIWIAKSPHKIYSVKINFDGSTFKSSGNPGIGLVARDSFRAYLACISHRLAQPAAPIIVEAFAAWEGILLALKSG